MKEWIFQLSKDDYKSLATVRCVPGLQVAMEENKIWLRGINATSVPDPTLLKLPLRKTLLLDEHEHLFPTGSVTPIDKLPATNWQPVAEFITVEPPVSSLPGKTKEKISIQLKASYEERQGIALLTSLSAWKAFAENAAEVRLRALRFAVSENEEVFIIGTPLPPLPGHEYWRNENLLLPSGYDFEIPVMAKLISLKLMAEKDDVIIFDPAGNWQRIQTSYFIPTTRSSIRLTKVKVTND